MGKDEANLGRISEKIEMMYREIEGLKQTITDVVLK